MRLDKGIVDRGATLIIPHYGTGAGAGDAVVSFDKAIDHYTVHFTFGVKTGDRNAFGHWASVESFLGQLAHRDDWRAVNG